MIAIRKSEERGRADHGGLDIRHTFSFADDGMALAAGDGAAISGEKAVRLRAKSGADALLFDLA